MVSHSHSSTSLNRTQGQHCTTLPHRLSFAASSNKMDSLRLGDDRMSSWQHNANLRPAEYVSLDCSVCTGVFGRPASSLHYVDPRTGYLWCESCRKGCKPEEIKGKKTPRSTMHDLRLCQGCRQYFPRTSDYTVRTHEGLACFQCGDVFDDDLLEDCDESNYHGDDVAKDTARKHYEYEHEQGGPRINHHSLKPTIKITVHAEIEIPLLSTGMDRGAGSLSRTQRGMDEDLRGESTGVSEENVERDQGVADELCSICSEHSIDPQVASRAVANYIWIMGHHKKKVVKSTRASLLHVILMVSHRQTVLHALQEPLYEALELPDDQLREPVRAFEPCGHKWEASVLRTWSHFPYEGCPICCDEESLPKDVKQKLEERVKEKPEGFWMSLAQESYEKMAAAKVKQDRKKAREAETKRIEAAKAKYEKLRDSKNADEDEVARAKDEHDRLLAKRDENEAHRKEEIAKSAREEHFSPEQWNAQLRNVLRWCREKERDIAGNRQKTKPASRLASELSQEAASSPKKPRC